MGKQPRDSMNTREREDMQNGGMEKQLNGVDRKGSDAECCRTSENDRPDLESQELLTKSISQEITCVVTDEFSFGMEVCTYDDMGMGQEDEDILTTSSLAHLRETEGLGEEGEIVGVGEEEEEGATKTVPTESTQTRGKTTADVQEKAEDKEGGAGSTNSSDEFLETSGVGGIGSAQSSNSPPEESTVPSVASSQHRQLPPIERPQPRDSLLMDDSSTWDDESQASQTDETYRTDETTSHTDDTNYRDLCYDSSDTLTASEGEGLANSYFEYNKRLKESEGGAREVRGVRGVRLGRGGRWREKGRGGKVKRKGGLARKGVVLTREILTRSKSVLQERQDRSSDGEAGGEGGGEGEGRRPQLTARERDRDICNYRDRRPGLPGNRLREVQSAVESSDSSEATPEEDYSPRVRATRRSSSKRSLSLLSQSSLSAPPPPKKQKSPYHNPQGNILGQILTDIPEIDIRPVCMPRLSKRLNHSSPTTSEPNLTDRDNLSGTANHQGLPPSPISLHPSPRKQNHTRKPNRTTLEFSPRSQNKTSQTNGSEASFAASPPTRLEHVGTPQRREREGREREAEREGESDRKEEKGSGDGEGRDAPLPLSPQTSRLQSKKKKKRKIRDGRSERRRANSHYQILMSWERDYPLGLQATRAPILYAMETIPEKLKAVRGGWINKAKLIWTTWKRTSGACRDQYCEKAKLNRMKVKTADNDTAGSPSGEPPRQSPAQPPATNHTKTRPNSTTRAATTPTTTPTPPTHQTTLRNKPSRSPRLTNPSHSKEKKTKNKSSSSHAQPRPEKSRAASLGHLVSDTASEGKRNDNKAHVRAAGKAEKGGKRSVKKEPEAGGSRASVTGEGDSVVVTMNEGDSAGTQSRSLVVTTPSPVQQMGLPLGLYSLPSPSPLSLSSSSPLGMLFYGPPQVLSSPVQPGSPSLSAGVVPSPLSPFVHLGLFPASGNPSAASPAETYPSFGMNMSRDQTSNSDKSATIPKRRGGVKKKHSQKRRASISAIPYSHSTPADGERDCSPTATCKSSPSTQTTPSKPEEGERDGSNLPPQTTQTTPSKPEEGERDRSNLPPQTTQTTPSKPEEGERDGSNLPPQTTQTTPSSDRLGHEQLSGSGELQTPTDGTSFIPSLASSTHPPSSLPSLPPAYSTTFLSSLAPPTSSQSHTQHPLTTHSSLPLTSSHNISAHHQNNSITTRRYSNSVTHRSPSHVTRDPNRHAHSNSTKVSRTRSITTSAGSSGSSVKTGSSSKLCRSSSSHHRRSSVPAAPSLSSLPAVAPPTTQYHSSTATAASVPLSSAPSVSPSLSVAPPCPSSLPSSFNSLPASLSATASHLEPTTNYCKPNSSTTPITTPTTTPTATPTTNSSTAPITTPTTKSSSTPLTTPTITPTSVTAFAAAANASIGSCIPSCVGRANTRPGSVNCEQNAHTMQSLCDVLATSDMEKFTVSESRLLLQEPYGVVNIYKQTNVTSSKPDPSAPPRNRSRVTAARTPKKVTAARTPKKQTDNRASRKGSKGTIEGSKPSSVSASTVGTASTMGTASTVGTYSNAVQVSAPVSKDFKQRPLHSSLPGLGGVSVGSCSNALVSNNLYRSHCPETDPNSIVNSEIGTKSSARPQSLETTRSGEKSARRVRKETPQSRRRNGSTASSKSSSRRPSRSESLQLPFFLSAEPEEVFGPGSVIPLGLNSLVPQLPTDLLFYSTAGGPASLMSVPPRVSESLPRVEPTSTSASFSGSVASTSLLRSRVHSLSQSSVGHTHNHHNRQTHSQHSVHGNYQQITTESISVKWEEQQYPFVPTAPITTPTATTTETGVGTMKKKNSASERRLEVAQPLPSLLSLHSLEGLQIAIAASSGQPMMSLPDRPKPKVSASVAGKTTSPSDKMRSSPGVTMMSPLGEMTSPASKVSKRPRLSSSERKRQKKKTPAANVQSTIAGRVKLADGSLTKPALPGPQSVLPQSRTAVPHTSMPYIAISHTAIPHATLLPGRAVAETPTPTPNTPPMLFGTAAGMTGFIPGLAGMNTGQPILIPGQPSLPFDQPTIIAGQSSSPLFSSSPDTAYSKNLAYWEMERLYYHNVALLEQQRKYTEFLESELKQMERAQIDAGNRVSEKQQQIYQQFLNYVAEPDYTPDVPLPFPECSQSQLEKTSEFKGTFDNPVLPPELDYYATFLRQINSHNVELKKPPSSTT